MPCGRIGLTENPSYQHRTLQHTVRTRIIEACARALELPLPVRSGTFLFFCLKPGRSVFSVVSSPIEERDFWKRLSRGFNYLGLYGTADYTRGK